MNIKEYTDYIKRNRTHYKNDFVDKLEATFGLVAEAGEVLGVHQKAIRKDAAISKEDVKSELGDVLYYLTTLAYHEGYTLEDLIRSNVKKLRERGWNK